ncbi:unnamed protein product [Blumeria hordei]|uniref:Uncharacterized protein n=1 Tax=Blumeria hordei TaxID=2867405 RepID=A0A383UV26_BLUHO|nr:unnamed protein product [Blumeria hordei]
MKNSDKITSTKRISNIFFSGRMVLWLEIWRKTKTLRGTFGSCEVSTCQKKQRSSQYANIPPTLSSSVESSSHGKNGKYTRRSQLQ